MNSTTNSVSAVEKWRELVDEYEKLVDDFHNTTLSSSTVGDVLYLVGVRDDIHNCYTAMSQKDKVQLVEVQKLTALDKILRESVQASKEPGFRWTPGDKNSEWWYKLDRLDELHEDDFHLI